LGEQNTVNQKHRELINPCEFLLDHAQNIKEVEHETCPVVIRIYLSEFKANQVTEWPQKTKPSAKKQYVKRDFGILCLKLEIVSWNLE
jgi:hypothetical protein